MLDRFSTVLSITPSFLVRFWLVMYQIEALDVLHAMVEGRSVRFSLWSGQRSGQTLVKLGQTGSNLVKLGQSSQDSGKCIPDPVLRVSRYIGPQSGRKWFGQTSVKLGRLLVKLGQPWSNLVNLGKTWSDFGKCTPNPILRLFDVASPRRIRPVWFRLPRFVCRYLRKSRG